MDAQRGIRKPRQLSAALSIRTVYRPEGASRPYEDGMGVDGFLRYKWRGDDPDHAENRALRAAMEQGVPMIWFFGVGVAQYQPVFPVFIVSEEPGQHQFAVTTEVGRDLARPDTPVEAQLRRYIIAETKRRLHQPVFRATVMRAYETRCAVCALRHGELLDAAHIVADSEEASIPVFVVTNLETMLSAQLARLRPSSDRKASGVDDRERALYLVTSLLRFMVAKGLGPGELEAPQSRAEDEGHHAIE